ncbi:DeoR/GlpR family DNA-binding transcription regulator [Nigerium massiliense]|uniref:DeoR/GlpR family DNA-binding transcription regulator n=1 Tax=Nigerium massiliense TaxID=1522317 RepID=UPI00058FFDB7|nr:DeoR/GlpR family DNA-binding transcription regulator [Nigerium massiliense]
MYAEERQQAIASLTRERGRVAVADLAQRFSVTSETVRRDLDALAQSGVIERVHGGAIPSGRLRLGELDLIHREDAQREAKMRIAQVALGAIPRRRDVTIMLDGGTTTARLADLLTPDVVGTVVTNSVAIAATLAGRGINAVHQLGGRVRGVTQTAVGAVTVEALNALHVDIAFVGANGFSARHGLSTPDPSEAAVKTAMVRAGTRSIALVDSSKANDDQLVRFAELSDIDVLITDTGLSADDRSALSDQEVEVVLA